jgi:putative redox protein
VGVFARQKAQRVIEWTGRCAVAAVKPVQVEARLGERFKIESQIRDHRLYVDQPKTGGGEDAGPTPLEYLFLSLAGCIATVARIVAKQQRITLRGMEVKVEGELDLEALLGRNPEVRSGFRGITVTARIDADLSREEKEKFLHEVDRRCPVSDNLQNVTPMTYVLE